MTRFPAVAAAALALCGASAAAAPVPPVPILEFHVIGDPAPGAPNQALYDAAATFRQQVAWLALHGYHGVTLDEVYRAWRSSGWLALPRKPVVLSFDDGYPQDLAVALPVLRARQWPGVLNLQVGNLVPARVRELIAAGWEVDAHTFTHPDLTTVGAAQLHHEVAGSRQWIQSVFGQPVDFFCYPARRYNDAAVAEVPRAGYLGAEAEGQAASSAPGAPGIFHLSRIEILRSDGVAGLVAQLG